MNISLTQKLAVCFLLSIIISAAIQVYQVARSDDLYWRADSTIFYTAATMLDNESPDRLYNLELQKENQLRILNGNSFSGGLLPFNYPPHFATLTSFISKFELKQFYQFLIITQVLLLGTFITILYRLKIYNKTEMLFASCLLFAQDSLFSTIRLGALSILILLALLLFYYSVKKNNLPLLSISILLLSFKPQFLVIVVPVICMLPLRLIAISAATLAAAPIISSFYFPITIWIEFMKLLRQCSNCWGELGIDPDKMVGLKAVLASLYGSEHRELINQFTKITFAAAVITSTIFSYLVRVRKLMILPNLEAFFCFNILLYMIFAIHLYPHDSLILCLPALLVYPELPKPYQKIFVCFMFICVLAINVLHSFAQDLVPYFTFFLSISLMALIVKMMLIKKSDSLQILDNANLKDIKDAQ